MQAMSGLNDKEGQCHHHLNRLKQSIQNKDVSSLVDVFKEINLCEGERVGEQMYNLGFGRIFPQNCNKLLEVNNQGNILYDKFITERLQEGSNIEILAPLKKVNAPIFKKAGKTKRVNANGKVHELNDCIDLFEKCLIVSSTRDIDMPKIIGEFELSTVTRSLMKAD